VNRQIAQDCPDVDPVRKFRFHRYPPEAKSLLQAQLQPEGSAQDGIDQIVDIVVRSRHPGCAPVRIVFVHGAADFDSRGTAFEDHVSVERAKQASDELSAAIQAALRAALERGEIADVPLNMSWGGFGSRGAEHKSPASEAERAENRFVSVFLSFGSPSETAPSGEAAETAGSGENAE
jgi:hypothetical protein